MPTFANLTPYYVLYLVYDLYCIKHKLIETNTEVIINSHGKHNSRLLSSEMRFFVPRESRSRRFENIVIFRNVRESSKGTHNVAEYYNFKQHSSKNILLIIIIFIIITIKVRSKSKAFGLNSEVTDSKPDRDTSRLNLSFS